MPEVPVLLLDWDKPVCGAFELGCGPGKLEGQLKLRKLHAVGLRDPAVNLDAKSAVMHHPNIGPLLVLGHCT